MNCLPNATNSSLWLSARAIAVSRVYPPALMNGLLPQICRRKSLDSPKRYEPSTTFVPRRGSTACRYARSGWADLREETKCVNWGIGSAIPMSACAIEVRSKLTSRRVDQTLKIIPRAYPNSGPLSANSLHHSICYFQSKSTPPLHTPAVLIRALVAYILYKLVYEVPIGTVDLDAVETCLVDGVLGSLSVQSYIFFYFRGGEFTRCRGVGGL